MAVPKLDPQQRQAALEKAAQVRRVRAELKQMLKAREVTLAEVFSRADSTEALGRRRVSEVIGAMPDHGPVPARKLMEKLDIAPTRRLRGLGPRQRAALLTTFDEAP